MSWATGGTEPYRQVPTPTSPEETWRSLQMWLPLTSNESVHHVLGKQPIIAFVRGSRYFGKLLIFLLKYLILWGHSDPISEHVQVYITPDFKIHAPAHPPSPPHGAQRLYREEFLEVSGSPLWTTIMVHTWVAYGLVIHQSWDLHVNHFLLRMSGKTFPW